MHTSVGKFQVHCILCMYSWAWQLAWEWCLHFFFPCNQTSFHGRVWKCWPL